MADKYFGISPGTAAVCKFDSGYKTVFVTVDDAFCMYETATYPKLSDLGFTKAEGVAERDAAVAARYLGLIENPALLPEFPADKELDEDLAKGKEVRYHPEARVVVSEAPGAHKWTEVEDGFLLKWCDTIKRQYIADHYLIRHTKFACDSRLVILRRERQDQAGEEATSSKEAGDDASQEVQGDGVFPGL